MSKRTASLGTLEQLSSMAMTWTVYWWPHVRLSRRQVRSEVWQSTLLLLRRAVTAYWTAPRLAVHETRAVLLPQSISTETFVGVQGTVGSATTT